MCGIAGIVGAVPDAVLVQRAAAMTQVLFHRGPDDGGLVAFDDGGASAAVVLGRPEETPRLPTLGARVVLGTRRLAILDLSPRGHQPMRSADGSAWITFNGEIYNYVELRDELRAAGVTFQTQTDTEVVLAAWLAWGRDCFERFDGMWALAIYEPAERRLTLSRDRFGIKPLYYCVTSAGLVFASEIKSLLLLPELRRRVNTSRLMDFLAEGLLDHTHETLYAGIYSLPAASTASAIWCKNGQIDLECRAFFQAGLIDADDERPVRKGGISEMAAEWQTDAMRLRAAMEQSVRLHLRSDVPVGSCLSGGIDSSAIVATLAALRNPRTQSGPTWSQHTFTAGLPGSDIDETAHARLAIAAAGDLQSHFVQPTAESLIEALPKLLWHQDEPFGSPSIYMQWEVMKAARAAGVPVLLDGQGADELFCGYPGYLPPYVAELVRRHRWGEVREIASSPFTRAHYSRAGLAYHAGAQLIPPRWRAALRGFGAPQGMAMISRRLLEEAGSSRNAARSAPFAMLGGPIMPASGFDRFWWRVLTCDSLPGLLHFEDRNSMAFSVEARVPFLGQAVWDAALHCPARLKLRGGWTKAILRQALRSRVPDAILDRHDKVGFEAPTLSWMRGPLRTWWEERLSDGNLSKRGWLQPNVLRKLARELDAGRKTAALALWRAAIAEQWAVEMHMGQI